MRFSLGKLDVSDKVGIGYFLIFGDVLFGDKNIVLVPSTHLKGRRDSLPHYAKRGKNWN